MLRQVCPEILRLRSATLRMNGSEGLGMSGSLPSDSIQNPFALSVAAHAAKSKGLS